MHGSYSGAVSERRGWELEELGQPWREKIVELSAEYSARVAMYVYKYFVPVFCISRGISRLGRRGQLDEMISVGGSLECTRTLMRNNHASLAILLHCLGTYLRR